MTGCERSARTPQDDIERKNEMDRKARRVAARRARARLASPHRHGRAAVSVANVRVCVRPLRRSSRLCAPSATPRSRRSTRRRDRPQSQRQLSRPPASAPKPLACMSAPLRRGLAGHGRRTQVAAAKAALAAHADASARPTAAAAAEATTAGGAGTLGAGPAAAAPHKPPVDEAGGSGRAEVPGESEAMHAIREQLTRLVVRAIPTMQCPVSRRP